MELASTLQVPKCIFLVVRLLHSSELIIRPLLQSKLMSPVPNPEKLSFPINFSFVKFIIRDFDLPPFVGPNHKLVKSSNFNFHTSL